LRQGGTIAAWRPLRTLLLLEGERCQGILHDHKG
jgi:hypothetical protein